jgi:hypothetical protein
MPSESPLESLSLNQMRGRQWQVIHLEADGSLKRTQSIEAYKYSRKEAG